MERDETNQQFSQISYTDQENGVKYQTRVLAFKNGVLYIELTLDKHNKFDRSHREMAIQAAVYYRNAGLGFETALAAKISIFTIHDSVSGNRGHHSHISLDSSIGIMYQDGVLN